MDRAGVELSVLSLSSPGTHFGDDRAARAPTREVNEFAAALGQAHPGRVGHLATLPLPDVEGALEEASYALDVLGADGLAVESSHHGICWAVFWSVTRTSGGDEASQAEPHTPDRP